MSSARGLVLITTLVALAYGLAHSMTDPVYVGGLERLLVILPDDEDVGSFLKELDNAMVDYRVVWVLDPLGPGLILETSEPGRVYSLAPRGSIIIHDEAIPGVRSHGVTSLLEPGLRYNPGLNVTGRGVRVAVIDTGINSSLPWLRDKVILEYDLVDRDNDASTSNPHGTVVASIIAGSSERFSGVAPGASILAYKIFSDDGVTSVTLLAEALDRALRDGADIINLSLGGLSANIRLERIFRRLYERGVLVVAAVGNSGPDEGTVSYPASTWKVLSVGATQTPFSESREVVAYLDGRERLSTIMHMLGSNITDYTVVSGRLVFVNHAREEDVRGMDLSGLVAVSVRDGVTFFGEMARNVALRGAIALVVVNYDESSFRGRIALPSGEEYVSPIPVFSISGREGARLINGTKRGASILIRVIPSELEPPASFSSRSSSTSLPVKPDVLAWGVSNPNPLGFNATGTSFSTAYVSGVLALMTEYLGKLGAERMYSALMLVANLKTDLEGRYYPPWIQGAGYINVSMVPRAGLFVEPRYIILYPTCGTGFSLSLRLGSAREGGVAEILVEGLNATVEPGVVRLAPGNVVQITLNSPPNCGGYSYGWLIIRFNGYNYTIPVYVRPIKTPVRIEEGVLRVLEPGLFRAEVTRPDGSRYLRSFSGNLSIQDGRGYYLVSIRRVGEPIEQDVMLVYSSGGRAVGEAQPITLGGVTFSVIPVMIASLVPVVVMVGIALALEYLYSRRFRKRGLSGAGRF